MAKKLMVVCARLPPNHGRDQHGQLLAERSCALSCGIRRSRKTMKELALTLAICALPVMSFAEEIDKKMSPTVTCSQFRDRFTEALSGNREGIVLADLFTGPKHENFDVSEIQAAIGCSSTGMFEGFGASLLETDDGKVRRYARFSAAALRAIEPSIDHSVSMQFMRSLTKDALHDARETERKTGQLRGTAERKLGSYVIDQRFSNGLVRTGIELRYKD